MWLHCAGLPGPISTSHCHWEGGTGSGGALESVHPTSGSGSPGCVFNMPPGAPGSSGFSEWCRGLQDPERSHRQLGPSLQPPPRCLSHLGFLNQIPQLGGLDSRCWLLTARWRSEVKVPTAWVSGGGCSSLLRSPEAEAKLVSASLWGPRWIPSGPCLPFTSLLRPCFHTQ